ncbi:hypothetical protein LCGC14_0827810 [marine sediment metagenome]|uniref:Pyridoxamine kinase/Phosphomethylpyrimidine kinase domain-containing protein n=1 Tax=marine sediment metagenome TaxID=412755 RepID=A0A0F9SP95_9ZZZZ|nr:MAG: Hydroxymethylpyrimidine/phosphomethylpyrimidine kinase [Candidatus Lokiarchaeum sp. GC14_75]
MKKVLTIAGSDSGGGAGIQADLKTFAALGVYGMSAITALTAQNTLGIQGIYAIDSSFVGKQIDSVMSDIGADAWKIGMLTNADIIRIVAERAHKYNIKLLIIDPVMIAKSGDPVLESEAINALILELIPIAFVITPNLHEAYTLTSIDIQNIEDAEEAARKIYDMGAKNVIIKGGHLPKVDEAIDLLYDGSKFIEYHVNRIKTNNTHGTGCTFASAIAAELAKGSDIKKAVHIAKAYLTAAIQMADDLNIGQGHGPTNHSQDFKVDVDLDLIRIRE